MLIKIEKTIGNNVEKRNIDPKDLAFYINIGWKKSAEDSHIVKKGKKRTEEEM